MYQNCCKKCGSTSLHTEVKGNNTGLYCDDCGAWQRWLGKDELRAFEYSMREATKEEKDSVNRYVESISKPTGVNFQELMEITIKALEF
jgi:transcription initiation factor TFIIIB Brf1 subunit/transcription initiation factor TFIIB